MDEKIALGNQVRDKVTSFSGVATGRAEYLFGSTQIYVEAMKKETNEPVGKWIEESRLMKE